MGRIKGISPPYCNDTDEIKRSFRYLPPAHCISKIQGFSLLSQILQRAGLDKHEFEDFEAHGYKWRLSLYPNGDTTVNGDGQISLSLQISEDQTQKLPYGWELYVMLKFFVYDQLRDDYLAVEDGKIRRFNALNKERGISQVLAVDAFNDTSNGYLVNDCCVFGAEVFILKCKPKAECLSMVRDPKNGKHTWKIKNFRAKVGLQTSSVFEVQGHKWRIYFYPKGKTGSRDSVSLYLGLSETNQSVWEGLKYKVYAEFALCIKDQVNNTKHKTRSTACMFKKAFASCGYSKFMALSDLVNANNGFVIADRMIVEAKITCISVIHQGK